MKSYITLKLIALFWAASFSLHFIWEMLQIPFYEAMTQAEHGAATWACTLATFGDTGIALVAYLAAAYSVRSLTWVHSSAVKPLSVYFLAGLFITVVFEFLATEVLHRWRYSELMPTVPLFGTGVAPLLQWIVVPALSLGASRLMYFGLLYDRRGRADEHRCLGQNSQ